METDFETYERCPICGHLVLLPCLACLLRRIGPSSSTEKNGEGELKLELQGKDYQRYQQVRRERPIATATAPVVRTS